MKTKIKKIIEPDYVEDKIIYSPMWKRGFFGKWNHFHKMPSWNCITVVAFNNESDAVKFIEQIERLYTR